jgi:hypothetical protein
MTSRYGQHHIVGSEAGRPRPMVYLHAGWRHRRFIRRRRFPWRGVFGALAVMAVGGGLWWTLAA